MPRLIFCNARNGNHMALRVSRRGSAEGNLGICDWCLQVVGRQCVMGPCRTASSVWLGHSGQAPRPGIAGTSVCPGCGETHDPCRYFRISDSPGMRLCTGPGCLTPLPEGCLFGFPTRSQKGPRRPDRVPEFPDQVREFPDPVRSSRTQSGYSFATVRAVPDLAWELPDQLRELPDRIRECPYSDVGHSTCR